MNRRKFFSRLAAAVASTSATVMAKAAFSRAGSGHHETRTVVFDIEGFSCVTCATGLEVMLMRHHGVIKAVASFPDAKATITFDNTLISAAALKDAIAGCGFTAREA
jgi:copper chaperone CopZ